MRYDIAIIGSGPAGLSAAVNAKIRNKNFIIFGNKNLSTKIEKAPSIDNYLGLYGISGMDLKQHFVDHINSMDIEIDERKITNVYALGDYFALELVTALHVMLHYIMEKKCAYLVTIKNLYMKLIS